MIGLEVICWAAVDCYFEVSGRDKDQGFLEYDKDDARTAIYVLSSYCWLFFRFISIIFFLNALSRFWNVLQQVKDEAVD